MNEVTIYYSCSTVTDPKLQIYIFCVREWRGKELKVMGMTNYPFVLVISMVNLVTVNYQSQK